MSLPLTETQEQAVDEPAHLSGNRNRRWMGLLLLLGYRLMRVYWFFSRPVTLGVRLLAIRDGSVLLVRHTYQDDWFLPGGGVKRGETLEQAVRREAMEECGATLHALDLFGVYSNFSDYKSDHIVVFTCTNFSLTGEPDHEIDRMALVPLNRLPPDLSPGSLHRIHDYLHGNRPTWGEW